MKMDETSKILLRRKHVICVNCTNENYEQTDNEKSLLVSMLKNIQSLGFTFSKELFEKLSHCTRMELQNVYFEVIPELKTLAGADVKYTPMYPNFPRQVVDASDAELFINAIIHYFTYGALLPKYKVDERLPLIDENKMTVLSVGKRANALKTLESIVASKCSISEQDKIDVITIIKEFPNFEKYLPDTIPLKENAALVGKLIIEESPIKTSGAIKKYFKTATDVLRLMVAMSDGDISLAKETKFRSFKRVERRIIFELLEQCGDILEDMYRYKLRWIYAGQFLHPSEYPRYKKVFSAFNTLRNEKKPLMFAGKVQRAILRHNTKESADLLKSRPGEFARSLDKLLRDSKKQEEVVRAFSEIADNVSTPVLLQVRQHFINRMSNKRKPVRVFFPKGNIAKVVSIENNLPTINDGICISIARICRDALIKQYALKENLGNVFVDKEFEDYIVPFSQRSASKAIKTITRGSRCSIGKNAQAVRAFIWWTNTNKNNIDEDFCGWGNDDGRVDIDLSASIYDENWNLVEHVSYTNLRSGKYKAYHSGDITNGGKVNGNGVAEFIDVDIDSVAKTGRYLVYQVHSFTRQKFSELPNCRFGWMEREDVNSGEIFEPKTVGMKMDLTSESLCAIPVIFDCIERKFIWADISGSIDQYRANNLENNIKGTTVACYAIVNMDKPNLRDLIVLNARARGNVVKFRDEADIIFSNDTTKPYTVTEIINKETGIGERVVNDRDDVKIVTAYDLDYYMSELL